MHTLQHGAEQAVVVGLQDAQPGPRLGQALAHDRVPIDAGARRELEQGVHLASSNRAWNGSTVAPARSLPSVPITTSRPPSTSPTTLSTSVRAPSRNTSQNSSPPARVADRADVDTVLVPWAQRHRDAAGAWVPRCWCGTARTASRRGLERGPDLLSGDDPLVAVALGPRLQAGEIRTGVRLAEPLAPQLLAAGDRRQEALLLLLGAELQQRRPEEVATLHADPVRGLGGRMLDVEDQLLCRRATATAVGLGPGDVRATGPPRELLSQARRTSHARSSAGPPTPLAARNSPTR